MIKKSSFKRCSEVDANAKVLGHDKDRGLEGLIITIKSFLACASVFFAAVIRPIGGANANLASHLFRG